MKYMVMECHPGYAVVLDEKGQFLKVANRQYRIGQMLTDVIPMQVPVKKKTGRWIAGLAAMAACLTLVLGMLRPTMQQPYASVYVKINPEVRIDVDKQDMVVGLSGVNQDGMLLIEAYDYRNKHLNLVTDELVDKAMDMGYLRPDGEITIRLDSQDQSWLDHHSQSLSHHLQERFSLTVQVQHHGEHHTQETYLDPAAEIPSTESRTQHHWDEEENHHNKEHGHDD